MKQAGDEAPDITLPTTGGEVTLAELSRGRKLVLAFYTEDRTPLCATQVGALKQDYDIIGELGANVLAVSADSLDSHRAFAREMDLPFPLASDEALEAARAFDVLDEDGKRSRRAVFVIEDGRIVHAEQWYQPGNPNQYEAIFRALGFEG
jgi:thioredoxin-dependent peroxiredoxin